MPATLAKKPETYAEKIEALLLMAKVPEDMVPKIMEAARKKICVLGLMASDWHGRKDAEEVSGVRDEMMWTIVRQAARYELEQAGYKKHVSHSILDY